MNNNINLVKSNDSNVSQDIHLEKSVNENKNSEEANALAEGLPEWSIEPPQLLVRRRRQL